MKYIKLFRNFILNENVDSNTFYHITPTKNIKNIKEKGLNKHKRGVFLTDDIKKAILWRDIKEDEAVENGYVLEKDWCILVIKNLNKNMMKHKDYYDVDFLDFPSSQDHKDKKILVDEYIYYDNIPPYKITKIITAPSYEPYKDDYLTL